MISRHPLCQLTERLCASTAPAYRIHHASAAIKTAEGSTLPPPRPHSSPHRCACDQSRGIFGNRDLPPSDANPRGACLRGNFVCPYRIPRQPPHAGGMRANRRWWTQSASRTKGTTGSHLRTRRAPAWGARRTTIRGNLVCPYRLPPCLRVLPWNFAPALRARTSSPSASRPH